MHSLGLSNPVLKSLYEEANELVEKWHGIVNSAFIKVTLPCISLPYFMGSFILYYYTDLGKDAFHLPFIAWWFLDWRNPLGYLLIFSYELLIIYYSIMFCAVFVCIPFGSCHFMQTFANDIISELKELNTLNEKSEIEFFNRFRKTIEFHVLAKR